jgi:hypothetical protein
MKKTQIALGAFAALAASIALMAPAQAAGGQSWSNGSGPVVATEQANWRGYYGGSGSYGFYGDQGRYGNYSGHRRYGDYRQNVCSPREAIGKAYRLGLRRAEIHRISSDVIVVGGHNYGHRARVVFARWSPNCRIIAAQGI